jgi:hypothetical protein
MPSEPIEIASLASTHELALSMLRLWGREAGTMARTYALDCWRKGDAASYMRWHNVEWHIEKALAGTQAKQSEQTYQGTVSGQQPQPTVRRPRWFEIPLEVLMPAIRQLGSRAIRGTGL